MGVAIVHPQDCLKDKPPRQTITSNSPKMKLLTPKPKPPRNTRTHPNRQKRSHKSDPQSVSNPIRPDSKPQANKLVMGQVKILKRGEQLSETASDRETETLEKEELVLPGTVYAGSSMFAVSPPPSSVPLPIFITKKIVAVSDATSDLRRMLRLDFH